MKTLSLLISCAALAVFTGCSTPSARISQSPEAFAKLSAADQQLIREGIELHIEALREAGDPVPPPTSKSELIKVHAA